MLNNYRHIGNNVIGEQHSSTVATPKSDNALYYYLT